MKARFFNSHLYCLMLLQLIFLTNQALADSAANRLSLAISGGASKGAYEAGLTWGIVAIIRQVREMPDGAIGGDLRPVDISSIAGTSAGGINTLLAVLVWAVKPESEGGFANHIGDNIFGMYGCHRMSTGCCRPNRILRSICLTMPCYRARI
jgi:hypothetical protein